MDVNLVERVNLYDGIPCERGLDGRKGGNRFVIDARGSEAQGHDLWIGGDRNTGFYVPLERGIFDELSRDSVENVARKLNNIMQGRANFYMFQHRISYGELVLALAQARIADMKIFEKILLDEMGGT